jgi:drug/metabolite transporter (DMT)-like permease
MRLPWAVAVADGGRADGAMPLSQWLLLLLLALLWGSAYVFVAYALRELPPLTVVVSRLGLAALVLAAVVQAMGLAWPRGLAGWLPFLGMAVFNNVIPFISIAYGQLEIASGLASVIVATTPLWTLLLSRMLLPGERIGRQRLAGILLGIAGVAVLFGPEIVAGRQSTLVGMALVLGAAISYGCAGVWGARLRGISPIVSSCCQLVCSACIVGTLALVVDRPWALPIPSMATVLSLLVLAVVSTALAYVVFYRVLVVSGGTNVMLVTLIMPPLTIWLGIALLGETFAERYACGAAIIAGALLVIDGRLPRAIARLLRG